MNINRIGIIFFLSMATIVCGSSIGSHLSYKTTPRLYSQETLSDSIQGGEELFIKNCKVCHSIKMKSVGPPLKNIEKRRKKSWVVCFIENADKLRLSGDKLAEKVMKENHYVHHPNYEFLNISQIDLILEYIKKESR
jgi:cytochrome c2